MIKLSLPDQQKLVPYLFSCPAAGSLAAGLLFLCTCAGLSIGLLGPDPWDNSAAPHLSGLFVQFVSSSLAWFWDHTRGQCKVLLDGQCHVFTSGNLQTLVLALEMQMLTSPS